MNMRKLIIGQLLLSLFLYGVCFGSSFTLKSTPIRLTLVKYGVQIEAEDGYFKAPYIVKPGETLQSIATIFYQSPQNAKILAQVNGISVDAPLSPGSNIDIIVTTFSLKFTPAKAQHQTDKVRSFIRAAGRETLYVITWDEVDVGSISLKEGKLTYKRFDPRKLVLTASNNKKRQVTFSFMQQPLLRIFLGNAEIEAVHEGLVPGM